MVHSSVKKAAHRDWRLRDNSRGFFQPFYLSLHDSKQFKQFFVVRDGKHMLSIKRFVPTKYFFVVDSLGTALTPQRTATGSLVRRRLNMHSFRLCNRSYSWPYDPERTRNVKPIEYIISNGCHDEIKRCIMNYDSEDLHRDHLYRDFDSEHQRELWGANRIPPFGRRVVGPQLDPDGPRWTWERQEDNRPEIPTAKRGRYEDEVSAIVQQGGGSDSWDSVGDTNRRPCKCCRSQLD